MLESITSPSAASARGAGRMSVLALTWILALSLPGAVRAEDSAASSAFADTTRPVTFLKEMLVTGARYPRAYYESPQALSFVSRAQIAEAMPNVTGDLFSTMPGVDDSKDSPWEQRPVLRGLGGQRVLVLVDGMPMNSARGNGPHPSLVDPSQIERVEVVRGPSSVAYGSDALGGVINIITREASFARDDQTFRGTATVGGSTADDQGNGSLQLMERRGKLSAYLSSGGRHARDYRSANGKVPGSAFDDYDALANVRYDFSPKTDLKLGWQLYRGNDIGIPGLAFAFPGASQSFDFPFYHRDYVHLTLDHGLAGTWLDGLRVKAYWQREHRNFASDQSLAWYLFDAFGVQPDAGPPTGPADTASATSHTDRYFDLSTVGAQAQLTSIQTSRYRFALGVDAARDMTAGDNVGFRTYRDGSGGAIGSTVQSTSGSVPSGDFDNYGAYAQSEWYLHPQWTLHTGGRFTQYHDRADAFVSEVGPQAASSRDDGALSGSAGLVWSPAQDLHLSGNVSSGYREPNAQDLYFSGPASVGFVRGNADLDPEKSVSYDVGLRWGPGSIAVAANAFYSTYRDLIDAVFIGNLPMTGPTYEYTNISEARIWGYEGEVEARLRSHWTARATLSDAIGDITSAKAIQALYNVSQDQVPLPGVPPIHGGATVRWSDARGRFWVEPGTRWSWRTSRQGLSLPGLPNDFKKEWIVGDVYAGAAFPWGQRLMLGVRNFTDRAYRPALASVDDPGINFVGQLTTSF